MCLNCGCGEPDTRHHPTDITRDDVEQAARGGGVTVDEAISNMTESLGKLGSESGQAQNARA